MWNVIVMVGGIVRLMHYVMLIWHLIKFNYLYLAIEVWSYILYDLVSARVLRLCLEFLVYF